MDDETGYSTDDLPIREESLHNAMARLACNKELGDVCFVVGAQKEEIYSVRAVLAIRNHLFRNLLYSPENRHQLNIPVPNVTPTAFRAILHYIFTDEVALSAHFVISALHAARQYQLYGLQMACIRFLATQIDVSNACNLLSQVIAYQEDELAQSILEFIDNNGAAVLHSDGFLELPVDCTALVIRSAEPQVTQVPH